MLVGIDSPEVNCTYDLNYQAAQNKVRQNTRLRVTLLVLYNLAHTYTWHSERVTYAKLDQFWAQNGRILLLLIRLANCLKAILFMIYVDIIQTLLYVCNNEFWLVHEVEFVALLIFILYGL